jgi:phosphoadenosine phosphosulfate reductase
VTLFQDIRSVSPDLSTPDLLKFLITEKLPGKTVVTASLRARSAVVLRLIADIDPATPVVFCHPGNLFPESLAYRERLVASLGLTNISESKGHETAVATGDKDHYERMWAEDPHGLGGVDEIVHVNQSLMGYDCWISAVYHFSRPPEGRHRVDVEGQLIRVDPLVRWSQDEIRRFMRDRDLPYHPRATRRAPAPPPENAPYPPTYHF